MIMIIIITLHARHCAKLFIHNITFCEGVRYFVSEGGIISTLQIQN